MTILAFDTCFSACSAAVGRHGAGGVRVVSSERRLMEAGQAETLMPMIERVIREAGEELAGIQRIVVTLGPGTFTGVRIGVAAARALSLATAAPVVGVSSLWAIAALAMSARGIARDDDRAVLVAMDARKGQVYAQVVDGDESELTPAQLLTPEDAAVLCTDRRLLVVGTAARQVAAAASQRGRMNADLDEVLGPEHTPPDAAVLLRAAHRAPSSGPLLPLYLRAPDTKPQVDKSLLWSST